MKRKIRYIACLLAVLMCSMLFSAKTVEWKTWSDDDVTAMVLLAGCAGLAATIFVIRQRER